MRNLGALAQVLHDCKHRANLICTNANIVQTLGYLLDSNMSSGWRDLHSGWISRST